MSETGKWRRPLALLAVLAAAVAAVAAVAVLIGAGGPRTLSADFVNAGQLVEGGRVQVAGRKVGSIAHIALTDDGVARIELSIDGNLWPLREGTRATIRAVGQAGLANRFIDLEPGPAGAAELEDGAVLPTAQTSGIVNVDALLDSFGPRQRAGVRRLIANSEGIYAGSGSAHFNGMLGQLSPALADLNGLTGDLVRDRVALRTLIDTAGQAAAAVASRRDDLIDALTNSAAAFGAIARERTALAGTLSQAPSVLAQAQGTLARTGTAVSALRPALREVPAAAGPLGDVLGGVARVLPPAGRMAGQLRRQLPDLQATLAGFEPLADPAVSALRSLGRSTSSAIDILEGFRLYGSDFVIGALASVGGVATGPYDARGHYGRVNFVQSPQTFLTGRGLPLLVDQPVLAGAFDVRTGLDRRCPGGNVPPAPDGSSPWILDESLCSPEANTPASVNGP